MPVVLRLMDFVPNGLHKESMEANFQALEQVAVDRHIALTRRFCKVTRDMRLTADGRLTRITVDVYEGH
jgi:hypothetical protein